MKTKKALLALLTLVLTINYLFAQSPSAIRVPPVASAAAQANCDGTQPVKETVLFDYGKYELTETAKTLLSKGCEKINPKEILQITLTGHTDGDGSEQYNMTLSENRTNAVQDYLVSRGISKDKIKVQFYGESKPLAQNDNEPGKQQNRRVEIVIEISKPVIARKPVITDIFSKFTKESQTFEVSANESITIKGQEGTGISIPKNSLVKQNGEAVKGEVQIELKEFYKKSDVVTSNLHTMSDKALLESAGMIYISVSQSGKKLKLKKGTLMTIEFAADKRIEGMGIFKGEQHDGQVNWIQQAQTANAIANVETRSISKGFDIKFRGKNMGFNDREDPGYDSQASKKVVTIDKMILTTGNLGWINCDRFYNSPNKTNLTIEIDTAYKPVVRLVFKNINCVMPGYYSAKNKVIFNSIPVGQKATIVAFSLVNDEPIFAYRDITISRDQRVNVELVKTTLAAIEQELKKLD